MSIWWLLERAPDALDAAGTGTLLGAVFLCALPLYCCARLADILRRFRERPAMPLMSIPG